MRGSKPKKKKLLIYHTPGRECAHADKGCCPSCFSPQVFRRFVSREFMPTGENRGR